MSHELESLYRAYIDCLNQKDWANLGQFVDAQVHHNGKYLGVEGYRAMLEQDYRDIPDLRFNIERVVVDTSTVASRLHFDCHPGGSFLGLAINGRRAVFHENVFYQYEHEKIVQVWSVIDKAAIEGQL